MQNTYILTAKRFLTQEHFPISLPRAQKTAVGPSRFICFQLGYDETKGGSRLLIFHFFSQPSSVHSPGITRWIDNLDETLPTKREPEEEGSPAWPPLPFGDAPLPVRLKSRSQEARFCSF